MEQGIVQSAIDKPLFSPTYLNIEYVFAKILDVINPIFAFLTDPKTWSTLGVISSVASLIAIAIAIFSLVRMREIQIHEKHELDHEIHQALIRDKEKERQENPKWHYILTLIESPNESDWRVGVIEADTMLEDALRQKGYMGETISELLEAARDSGYSYIQGAWDAHLTRNKIAHEGSQFPFSQLEARKSIKAFQGFFEELGII